MQRVFIGLAAVRAIPLLDRLVVQLAITEIGFLMPAIRAYRAMIAVGFSFSAIARRYRRQAIKAVIVFNHFPRPNKARQEACGSSIWAVVKLFMSAP
jgi:hypothetical protein